MLGLVIRVVPAITTAVNETATEQDAIRRGKQDDNRALETLVRK
jgi:hypothetical protein